MTDTRTAPPTSHAAGAPWSLKNAREYLGISERTLRKLTSSGAVRTIRIGDKPMVPDAEVRRLAAEGTA